MNNNSKKNIFTKKNLIIGVCILLFILFLIYFIFIREPKEKIIKCTMSIDNYEYANIDISIDAYYSKKINRLEGKINYEIFDDNMKKRIDKVEESLKNYYQKSIKGEGLYVNVYRENFNIVLDYSIDYSAVTEKSIESFNFFSTDGITEKMTVDEFKNQIIESGGNCVEE